MAHRGLGLALGAFGALMVVRWTFQIDAISQVLPGTERIGLVTSLMFLSAGVCCVLLPHEGGGRLERWGALAAMGLLLAFPLGMLFEHLTHLRLGIDFVRVPTLPTAASPYPGRMSPNACMGFLLSGLAFLAARRPLTGRRDTVFLAAMLGVALIGLSGLVGHLLRLSSLYQLPAHNSMQLPTAVGLSILAGTLWLLHEHIRSQGETAFDRLGPRIGRRSLALFTLVVLGAGVAGFSVLRGTFEEAASDNLLVHATTHAASLTNTLEVGLWMPRALALRPEVQQAVAGAQRGDAADPGARLKPLTDGAFTAGLSAIRFLGAEGQVLATRGSLSGGKALSVHPLPTSGQSAWLMWDGGYVLQVRSDVMHEARRVGYLVTEQRLPLVDRLLADLRASGESTDALLCSQLQGEAICAPTRFNPRPFRVPMFDANGQVHMPINRALLGQDGVLIGSSRQETTTLSAFAPLEGLGMGLVVEVDVQTLYAPLRQRLHLLVGILIGLIAFGSLVLRSQVRPLVKKLANEQRRTRVILDHANDAFVALGTEGEVTDWNSEAERTFGWKASEAMGRKLSELIIPEEARAAHARGFQQFAQTGTGPVVNRRIEVMALHRRGYQFPVELSVAAIAEGQGHAAAAFVRDITDRRMAQQKLADSEKRLRSVTDNLPGLMSHIDTRHTLTFCNATFQAWMGIDPQTAVGLSLESVIGPTLYDQQLPHLQRALKGERAEFEMASDALNVRRYLKNVYIPDVDAEGRVVGVYALSTDVTAMKLVELHLNELARVDALTGLPNRRQFEERLQEAIARSRRTRRPMALMFLDVDHFKRINDTHGHAAGDAVLKEFSSRLRNCLRATDTVARLAGDEFVVILEGLNANEEASRAAEKIGAMLRTPIDAGHVALNVTSSIGVAFFNGGDAVPEAIIAKADAALYKAKRAGRDTFALSTF